MRLRALFALAGLIALASAAPAAATTFTVTGTDDGTGSCTETSCTTIRAALVEAARVAGTDTVSLPAGAYRITQGQLDLTSPVTVVGASAVTTSIAGDGESSRIFSVSSGQTATIQRLTIKDGASTASADTAGGNVLVNTGATLTVDHARITNGRALRGGGIAIRAATVQISRSLIDNNHAVNAAGAGTTGDGGGIVSIGDSKLAGNVLRLTDSTVAYNHALVGAGIVTRDNPANVTTLDRVTLARNSAGTLPGAGLWVLDDGESVALGSTIVAANTGDGVQANCNLKPTSTGGNIDTGTTCGFGATDDRPSTDPQLDMILTMAGGETPVLAIPALSPAVDFAPACSVADQRDLGRPQGKSCDSGAYELDQAPDTKIDSGPSGLINTSTATFTYSSPEPGAGFECALDTSAGAGAFGRCSSAGITYSALPDGAYTFHVRANDGTSVDPSPPSRSFTVDATAPAAPTIVAPAENAVLARSTVLFSGTAEAGAAVQLFEGTVSRGTTTAGTGGAWTITASGVADGSHGYTATARDAALNTSPASTTRTIRVDTGPPAAAAVTGPSGPIDTASPQFGFTYDEGGSTFECALDSGSFAPCASPMAYSGLSEGPHSFRVRVRDSAGNAGPPVERSFTVDTTPPPPPTVESGPAGTTTETSPAFAFSAPGATAVTCRLDGPGGAPGTYAPCSSPMGFSALAPGDYVFFVRSVDAAGNATTTERAFTVTLPERAFTDTVPQQATPTPTPSPRPTPTATPGPTPTFHQTVVVEPAGGTVLVRVRGTSRFVPLDVTKGIPLGSEVDVRKGKVRLFSVPRAGAPPESAIFYDGIFVVTQAGNVTELRLNEKLTGCKTSRRASAAAKKVKTRKLWGDGKGTFRTRGQYSAATVRGTRWLVQDSCTTTLTRVAQGVVAVNDFALKKTVLVKAGKRYIARAQKYR